MTKKKIYIPIILGVGALLLFNVDIVKASIWDSLWSDTGGEETVKFLSDYQDYLSYGNFFTIMLHWFGWALIKGLFFVTEGIEKLIPESLSLLNFLDHTAFSTITKAIINDLVVVLMVLVFVYLGFKTVVAKQPPNFKSVGVNVALSVFLILGLPTLIDTMDDISKDFFNATQSGGNNNQVSSLSWNLIQENVNDLLYISSSGFSGLNEDSKTNDLNPNSFRIANLNALITPDTVSDIEGDDIKHLAYKLDVDESGNVIADKIDGGAFSFFTDSFDEGYFRYQAQFTPILIGLAALLIAYLFTLFIFITTIIEIGFKQVVGLFVFATDLESGQRTKMVMQDILNAFMLIAFTGLSLKLYTVFLSYLATTNVNFLIYIVAIISATVVLLKGSNTIMRYFGIDVGIKEGMGQFMATVGAVRALSGFGKDSFSFRNKKNGSNENENKNRLNDLNDSEKNSINDDSKGTISSNKKSINNNPLGNMKNAMKARLGDIGHSVNVANEKESGAGIAVSDEMAQGSLKSINGVENKLGKNNNPMNSINENMNQENALYGSQLNSEKELFKGKNGANYSPINDQNDLDNKSLNGEQRENVQSKMNPTLNHNGVENTQMNLKTNDEILTEMKLKDVMNPKNVDTEANMRLNTIDGNTSINERGENEISRSRQEVAAGHSNNSQEDITRNIQERSINDSSTGDAIRNVRTNESNINPLRQDVEQNMKPNSMNQSVTQTVTSMNGGNVAPGTQTVTQNIKQGSEVAPSRQRVAQDISVANIATPQQIRQNVEQVMTSARLPQETQQTVRRVLESAPSEGASETIKTRVIQELENASFGGKEPIRQQIMQSVQRAFTPTPQQVEQNVKQVTEATKQIKTDVQNQGEQSGYFGSLFGEKLNNESNLPRRSSRFDFIRNRKGSESE